MAQTTQFTFQDVKGVILDVDGTLITSGGPFERSWTRWAAKHRIDLVNFPDGITGNYRGWRVQDAMIDLDPSMSREQAIDEEYEFWELQFQDLDGVELVPGVQEFFDALAAAEARGVTIPKRYVTGADARISKVVEAVLGIEIPDAHILGATDVKFGKPNPEGHLRMLESMGLTPADYANVISIGDGKSDIPAGRDAGTRTISLLTGVRNAQDRANLETADIIVPDFRNLSLAVRNSGVDLRASGVEFGQQSPLVAQLQTLSTGVTL